MNIFLSRDEGPAPGFSRRSLRTDRAFAYVPILWEYAIIIENNEVPIEQHAFISMRLSATSIHRVGNGAIWQLLFSGRILVMTP